MNYRLRIILYCVFILSLQACSSLDYTKDNALSLCEHMNIETESNGYPHCFEVTSGIYNTYPKLNIQDLIQKANHICDDADLDIGDKNYPSCFMRTTIPLVKTQGVHTQNWEAAMQKLILINKNYNAQ